MLTVGAFEAKTKLSELLDAVERGEEVVITRHGQAIARLVPVKTDARREELKALSERIKALRDSSGLKDTTLEELMEWKNEGRR